MSLKIAFEHFSTPLLTLSQINEKWS